MITSDREYRMFDVGIVERAENSEEMIVEGYACIFDKPTMLYEFDGVKYYEKIDRNAFAGANIKDVVLNVDHSGTPVARTKNNSLELTIDNKGLKIRADISKSDDGRKLYEKVKARLLDKMSFAFSISSNEYNRETRTNTITGIKRLYDVSIVTFAAYEQTSVNARSKDLFIAEAEKERAEARENQLLNIKKKLLLEKLKMEE